jgi:excisionase family DNA binding protein
MSKLNLKQMAKRLNQTPKTFRKYVDLYRIPHIKLGNRFLFDAEKVERYLENVTMEAVKEPKIHHRISTHPTSEWAKDFGLN